MFKKICVVFTVMLAGVILAGCPPDDNNNNNGTEAQFTVMAESLVPEAFFGKVFAVTHDDDVRVFRLNQAVGQEFLDFNFMNDSTALLNLLSNAAGVTDVFATEDDLAGLIVPNDTLTLTITGFTDDVFTVMVPQFQTPSTFAALNAVPLPASGSQVHNLAMFSLDNLNRVVTEPGTTVYVRVTVTRM